MWNYVVFAERNDVRALLIFQSRAFRAVKKAVSNTVVRVISLVVCDKNPRITQKLINYKVLTPQNQWERWEAWWIKFKLIKV